MPRLRILLVPHFSELDWRIKPLLEEWAQVASFDAPGVGDEPPPDAFTTEAVVERGVAELDRQGWDRCVVVGDELGAHIAVHLAAAVPARLDALALGHACVRFRRQGAAPTISPEVLAGLVQMARTDYRSYARMLTHFSQGAYDDELVDRYIERVPGSVAAAYLDALLDRQEGEDLGLRYVDSTCRFSWRNAGAASCSPPRATRKPWRPSRKPPAPPSTSNRARARSSRRRSAPSATSCPPRRPAWREDGARELSPPAC